NVHIRRIDPSSCRQRYNPDLTKLARSMLETIVKGITMAVLIILVGSIILPLFALTATFGQSINSRNDYLALVGGTIYVSPTEEPIRDGVVVINNGKIADVGTRRQVNIPQPAQVVDCAGRTITAGFWNSHVHFMERKW